LAVFRSAYSNGSLGSGASASRSAGGFADMAHRPIVQLLQQTADRGIEIGQVEEPQAAKFSRLFLDTPFFRRTVILTK
jgi:hypothetical protein